MAVVRVLVADDSAPWRWVVSAILQRSSCCNVVGEASDGSQAVQKSIELQPDVVLLDIGLPKLNGLDAARQIRSTLRDCKIVLISELMSSWAMSSIVGIDVQACLCKCELVSELLSTIDGLHGRGEMPQDAFGRTQSDHAPGQHLQKLPDLSVN